MRRDEHGWSWWSRNLIRLMLYLVAMAFALSVVGALMALLEAPAGQKSLQVFAVIPAVTAWITAVGGLGCLPGTLLWLFAVSRYPIRWSTARRRLLAVLTTPLIGAFWAFWSAWGAPTPTGILRILYYGVLLPLGAGLVVKLPAPPTR